VIILYGQNADGGVLVVYDAVDARLAVRPDHAVLADRDPGVLVDVPRTERPPRAPCLPSPHTSSVPALLSFKDPAFQR
jgi:hypothetical protein